MLISSYRNVLGLTLSCGIDIYLGTCPMRLKYEGVDSREDN